MAKPGYSPIAKMKALEQTKIGGKKPILKLHLTDTYINWVIGQVINADKSERSSMPGDVVARKVVDYIKNEDAAVKDAVKDDIKVSDAVIREGGNAFRVQKDRKANRWYAIQIK